MTLHIVQAGDDQATATQLEYPAFLGIASSGSFSIEGVDDRPVLVLEELQFPFAVVNILPAGLSSGIIMHRPLAFLLHGISHETSSAQRRLV
jgi:hypothetical protein